MSETKKTDRSPYMWMAYVFLVGVSATLALVGAVIGDLFGASVALVGMAVAWWGLILDAPGTPHE